jgi:hypothetical protein
VGSVSGIIMKYGEDSLKHALGRTDMPRGQVTLLKYLYENEGFSSTKQLAEGIRGGDTHSCISVLGPFSNRVNDTNQITGEPGYRALIETEKRDGSTHYRLRDEGRQVIKDTPALMARFDLSMTELRNMENPVIKEEEFDI